MKLLVNIAQATLFTIALLIVGGLAIATSDAFYADKWYRFYVAFAAIMCFILEIGILWTLMDGGGFRRKP